jgi:predicted transcriptional regulator
MSRSTKPKTRAEIAEIRERFQAGESVNAIAQSKGFSKNTVRKIIRHTHGYEGVKFNPDGRWKGRRPSSPIILSEVDGEQLHLNGLDGKDGYVRVYVNGKRHRVHQYEARKVFRAVGRTWPKGAIVHHIDHNRENYSLDNIAVFNSNSLHAQHHGQKEVAMHNYLTQKDLLKEFHQEYPEFELETLADILKST